MDNRIIFIAGVGRSGTTLLQAILNAHPAVTFMPETHFLRRHVSSCRSRLSGVFRSRSRRIARIVADPFLKRVNWDIATFFQNADGLQNASSVRFFGAILKEQRTRFQAEWVGDKDPKHLAWLSLLNHHFPGARCIHVVRDPRDVVCSRRQTPWSGGRPLFVHALTCRIQLQRGFRDGERVFGHRFRQIRYEDLVGNPRGDLTELCRWLDIPFHPAMLRFHQTASELVAADERQWKAGVLKPLFADSIGRWQRELSSGEIRMVESICGPVMAKLNYPASEGDSTAGWKARAARSVWRRLAAAVDFFASIRDRIGKGCWRW